MERAELARALGAPALRSDAVQACASVISAERPDYFMSAFASAVAEGGTVFLADPTWDADRRARVEQCIDLAGERRMAGVENPERGWLMIPSGGSSGGLKFARHDQDTLTAAVRGFCTHFGLTKVNAVGLLPLYHVSGLMAWMRCALTGGAYLPWDWADVKDGRWPEIAADTEWVVSLVPTQLQRLLEMPAAIEWLRRFKVIFVGGGPVWRELAEKAAAARLPISLSYGMTETAAMVTALRPAEFLAGARSSGTPLPHARVAISDDGVIMIGGESVARGYFPEWREGRDFQTEDLGHFDVHGNLHVVGRRDAVIITGGKKVQPAEVESALRATGRFADIAVIGLPDAEWGEAVVACYPADHALDDRLLRDTMAETTLAGYQRPKRFVVVPEQSWPRNAQGKVNRAALRALASGHAGTA